MSAAAVQVESSQISVARNEFLVLLKTFHADVAEGVLAGSQGGIFPIIVAITLVLSAGH